jgi:hypothetical protein
MLRHNVWLFGRGRERMKYECGRNGVWQLEFANAFDGAVVIDESVDHHFLLLVSEGADAGDDRSLIDHFGRDGGRLRLIHVRGFLGLRGESVEDTRKKSRRYARAAAGSEKTSTVHGHQNVLLRRGWCFGNYKRVTWSFWMARFISLTSLD